MIQNPYNAVFDPKNQALRAKNTLNCNNSSLITNTYQGQTPFLFDILKKVDYNSYNNPHKRYAKNENYPNDAG